MAKKPRQHEVLDEIAKSNDGQNPVVPDTEEMLDFAERALNPQAFKENIIPHEDTVDMEKMLERARRKAQLQELTCGDTG